MKDRKDTQDINANQKEVGGYRTHADDYKHIINDYLLRVSVIKETNIKLKRIF